MAEQVRVYEISTAAVTDLNNNEICSQTVIDADLGYYLWGGKDNGGNITQWLAKNEDAKVANITITGDVTVAGGTAILDSLSLTNLNNYQIVFGDLQQSAAFVYKNAKLKIGGTSDPEYVVDSESASANHMRLLNSAADAIGATMVFEKQSASPADDDVVGAISMKGYDGNESTPATKTYGTMYCQATDVSDETGKWFFSSLLHGNSKTQFGIEGNSFLSAEVDETPSALSGFGKWYVKSSDGLPYFKDSSGSEFGLTAGSGDVVGPGSSTDNAIVRWDGATGQAVQDSGIFIDDSNYLGVNTSSPMVRAHIADSSSTQLRLEYDVSNVCNFTVGSGGDLTIAPSGGDFVLAGNVGVSGALTATSFSGVLVDGVTGTTQSASDNSTKVATTAYVDTAVGSIGPTFLGLSDTIAGYTSGRLLYESGAAVVDSANLTFSSNKLTVTNTAAAQMRLAYDGSNYAEMTCNSSGDLVISPTGGNIGIGTTPAVTLDIEAASARTYLTSSTGTSNVFFRSFNGSSSSWFGTESSVGGTLTANSSAYATVINSSGAYPVQIGTNDVLRMTINGTGVGIGTTSPARKLDILDASNPQLRLTHTAGSVYADLQCNSSGNLVVSGSSGGGNVGVGLAPTAPIDIKSPSSGGAFRIEQNADTNNLFLVANSSDNCQLYLYDSSNTQTVTLSSSSVSTISNSSGLMIETAGAGATQFNLFTVHKTSGVSYASLIRNTVASGRGLDIECGITSNEILKAASSTVTALSVLGDGRISFGGGDLNHGLFGDQQYSFGFATDDLQLSDVTTGASGKNTESGYITVYLDNSSITYVLKLWAT